METTSNICRNKFASIFCSTANTMTTYRPTATVIIDDKIHLPSRTWLVTEAWTTSPHSSSISSSNSSSSDDPCLIRSNERCLNSNSSTNNRNKTSFNNALHYFVIDKKFRFLSKRANLFKEVNINVVYFDQRAYDCACVCMVENDEKRLNLLVEMYQLDITTFCVHQISAVN